MPAKPPPADAGFTLLEVLVAFIIASLAFAVLAGAALDGMRSASLSNRYQEALTRARSHLAAIGPALQPSDRQGDEGDGFHWHVRIVQLASAPVILALPGGNARPSAAHATLYAISVGMSWGEHRRRQVELDSERVGTTSAPAASP
ncbi:prepilin-type N-terminal cleavage/methylation domain-containing protein [Acidisoma cellulosilytica]|uniref:Prepilin-type N-terminal cleavage/methylation domain-containing protein n=1 Tax=Acidisoma cellulosilyticum TaxID=2802395 RepID=A0A964E6N8_9PROT|nr:prepilin-type N-terminal cleavage/methylation domain-containing protein [Acidisoma cellulosilyticum]MCB8883203.1 prepilin-type N-terminal cleavage/methylation domain-containing protein [Acidisoma cellulosilyticum]